MAHYFSTRASNRAPAGRLPSSTIAEATPSSTVQERAQPSGQCFAHARGIGPEDRVLIGLFDSVEFAAAFFGVLKLGAVVTMVNPDCPTATTAITWITPVPVRSWRTHVGGPYRDDGKAELAFAHGVGGRRSDGGRNLERGGGQRAVEF